MFAALALAVAAAPCMASAATFPEKPPKEHFYVDQADLLNTEDAEAVDQIAGKLLEEEDIPLLVVTIPSLVRYEAVDLTVEQYARKLFDAWGIGSQERNYGILLLVSVADRKARIELGADWNHQNDQEARYVMDKLIIPKFKAGDFSGGIREGAIALDKMARGLGLPKPKRPWWVPLAVVAVAVLLVWMIVSLFRSGRKGWAWMLIIGIGIALFIILRAAANNAGSGGAFGGGSSGGGGATGSW